MCLIANYSTVFFSDKISEKTAGLGGIILIGVGLYNLLKKKNGEVSDPKNTFL